MTAKEAQSQPRHRLDGKVAVITGGSSGIGFAVARALVAEGCNVVITGRDEEKLNAATTKLNEVGVGTATGHLCDVRGTYSVDAVFDMVKTRFGRIDILVNNAGISQAPTPVDNTSVEMWREMIDIDLSSVFVCTRAALPMMGRGSTIINNLSAAAVQTFPNFSAYTAAKSGAYGFTRALRDELMPRGIRVTALMPGATSTDIWKQIMPEVSHEGMMNPETIAQTVLYTVLLPPEANVSELLITPTAGAVGAKNTGE